MAASGRKRGRIFILIAFLLLAFVAVVVFLMRDQLLPRPVAVELPTPLPAGDTEKILVLFQPVARGTVLSTEMVSTVDYPRASLIDGLFYPENRLVEVLGKRAKYDLDQGTPITPSLITDDPAGSYASQLIPDGMVALPIPISRLTSVAYALQPGDHVYVIGSFLFVDLDTEFQTKLPNFTGSVTMPGNTENGTQNAAAVVLNGGAGSAQGRVILDTTLNVPMYLVPSEEQRPRLVTQTIIEDATVLWVGDFTGGEITSGPQPTPTPMPDGTVVEDAATKPQVITIIVSPQDAVTLNYLLLSGVSLNLALRANGDDHSYPGSAVTLQFIMDQYGIPGPSKLPYGLEPRVDQLAYPTTAP